MGVSNFVLADKGKSIYSIENLKKIKESFEALNFNSTSTNYGQWFQEYIKKLDKRVKGGNIYWELFVNDNNFIDRDNIIKAKVISKKKKFFKDLGEKIGFIEKKDKRTYEIKESKLESIAKDKNTQKYIKDLTNEINEESKKIYNFLNDNPEVNKEYEKISKKSNNYNNYNSYDDEYSGSSKKMDQKELLASWEKEGESLKKRYENSILVKKIKEDNNKDNDKKNSNKMGKNKYIFDKFNKICKNKIKRFNLKYKENKSEESILSKVSKISKGFKDKIKYKLKKDDDDDIDTDMDENEENEEKIDIDYLNRKKLIYKDIENKMNSLKRDYDSINESKKNKEEWENYVSNEFGKEENLSRETKINYRNAKRIFYFKCVNFNREILKTCLKYCFFLKEDDDEVFDGSEDDDEEYDDEYYDNDDDESESESDTDTEPEKSDPYKEIRDIADLASENIDIFDNEMKNVEYIYNEKEKEVGKKPEKPNKPEKKEKNKEIFKKYPLLKFKKKRAKCLIFIMLAVEIEAHLNLSNVIDLLDKNNINNTIVYIISDLKKLFKEKNFDEIDILEKDFLKLNKDYIEKEKKYNDKQKEIETKKSGDNPSDISSLEKELDLIKSEKDILEKKIDEKNKEIKNINKIYDDYKFEDSESKLISFVNRWNFIAGDEAKDIIDNFEESKKFVDDPYVEKKVESPTDVKEKTYEIKNNRLKIIFEDKKFIDDINKALDEKEYKNIYNEILEKMKEKDIWNNSANEMKYNTPDDLRSERDKNINKFLTQQAILISFLKNITENVSNDDTQKIQHFFEIKKYLLEYNKNMFKNIRECFNLKLNNIGSILVENNEEINNKENNIKKKFEDCDKNIKKIGDNFDSNFSINLNSSNKNAEKHKQLMLFYSKFEEFKKNIKDIANVDFKEYFDENSNLFKIFLSEESDFKKILEKLKDSTV